MAKFPLWLERAGFMFLFCSGRVKRVQTREVAESTTAAEGTPSPNCRTPERREEELKQNPGLVGYSQGSTRDGTYPIQDTRGVDRRGRVSVTVACSRDDRGRRVRGRRSRQCR